MNQRKVGAVLNYVSLFLGNIVSIIYTPIMLRLLGQSEYGILGLVNSITSYLGLLTFGLGASFIRNNTQYRVNNDKVGEYNLNGMYFIIFSIISVITLICGGIMVANSNVILGNKISELEQYKCKIIMLITVINMAVNVPFSIFEMNINAYEKYLFGRTVNIVKTVLNPFVTLPLLLLGYRSIGLTIATFVISMLSIILNVIYSKKVIKMKVLFKKFDFHLMKQIFIFSFFIFLNLIIDQINWNIDKFLLGIYKGTVAVAIYTVGSQFNSYLLSFSTTLTSVLTPKINNMVISKADDREVTEEFTKVGRLQFIMTSLIMLGYFAFGRKFVSLWAGADYAESYYVGLLLMISIIVPSIQTLGTEIRKAKNKHMIAVIFLFFMAIVNLLISIPLCKLWGPIGSALGTAISLIINAIFNNFYYHKYINIDINYFWKEIMQLAKSTIIPTILAILIFFIDIKSIAIYLCIIILYTILFGYFVYFFGMNEYEKTLCKSFFNKVKGRVC